jgi:hypothetical protein
VPKVFVYCVLEVRIWYPHIHISLVSVREVNFVLFNSMLKYVINRLMHAFFYFRTVVIPRPISTLGLKPSGRYRSLSINLFSLYHQLTPNSYNLLLISIKLFLILSIPPAYSLSSLNRYRSLISI